MSNEKWLEDWTDPTEASILFKPGSHQRLLLFKYRDGMWNPVFGFVAYANPGDTKPPDDLTSITHVRLDPDPPVPHME
jgi:hypothetical protein